MAEHGNTGSVSGEVGAHEATYSGFLAMMKWGTLVTILVTAVVVILIAS